jgi:hypothetical protein
MDLYREIPEVTTSATESPSRSEERECLIGSTSAMETRPPPLKNLAEPHAARSHDMAKYYLSIIRAIYSVFIN